MDIINKFYKDFIGNDKIYIPPNFNIMTSMNTNMLLCNNEYLLNITHPVINISNKLNTIQSVTIKYNNITGYFCIYDKKKIKIITNEEKIKLRIDTLKKEKIKVIDIKNELNNKNTRKVKTGNGTKHINIVIEVKIKKNTYSYFYIQKSEIMKKIDLKYKKHKRFEFNHYRNKIGTDITFEFVENHIDTYLEYLDQCIKIIKHNKYYSNNFMFNDIAPKNTIIQKYNHRIDDVLYNRVIYIKHSNIKQAFKVNHNTLYKCDTIILAYKHGKWNIFWTGDEKITNPELLKINNKILSNFKKNNL